jgi:hypothetical protein
MRQLLDTDPLTGVSTYFNSEEGQFRFTSEQDVSLILDGNKSLANRDSYTTKGIKEDMWHYATIPAVVELEWKQKHGVTLEDPNHRKKIFDLLNHPDYRYLKTTTKIHRG